MTEALLPEGWPRPKGYANGIAATGRIICVAGQVGWDPVTEQIREGGFPAQLRAALANVLAVVRAGGAGPADVVRMTWFLTDLDAYRASRREIGAIWRDLFGTHYPAFTVVQVSGLLEEGALIEIEATAVAP